MYCIKWICRRLIIIWTKVNKFTDNLILIKHSNSNSRLPLELVYLFEDVIAGKRFPHYLAILGGIDRWIPLAKCKATQSFDVSILAVLTSWWTTVKLPVIYDARTLTWRHFSDLDREVPFEVTPPLS